MTIIKNTVLKTIFGETKYNDALMLLDNVKKLSSYKYNYEFELRFIDNNGISCLENTYKTYLKTFENILDEESYTDYIIEVKQSTLKTLDHINYRYITKTDLGEQKIMISRVDPYSQTIDIPITMKLSIEQIDSNIKNMKTIGYQRRQRISFKLLDCWKIDATIRFYTDSLDNKKLNYVLNKSNVISPEFYDTLDIEFEYVGDWKHIYSNIFKLFEYIYPSYFKEFNVIYKEICSKYHINLSRIFPNVSIVTNKLIADKEITQFVYMEKYDGERKELILYGDIFYEMTKKYFKIIYNHTKHNDQDCQSSICKTLERFGNKKVKNQRKLTILDCEQMGDQYLIFDIIYYEDINLNKLPFSDRMKYSQMFTDKYKQLKCSSVIVNTIDKLHLSSWSSMIEYVASTNKSSIYDMNIDGLILRDSNATFIDGGLYKLKNNKMLTIDFKIKYVEQLNAYYLYLIGNTCELLKTSPISNPYQTKHHGYNLVENTKNVYMLFDTPFFQNSCIFTPRKHWNVSDMYTPEMIKYTNKIMDKMINYPEIYDDKIIELSYAGDGWIPLRIRSDKIYSNGYTVGLSIMECLYNQLSEKYHISNGFKDAIRCLYNDFMLTLYRYIIEKYMNNHTNTNIILNINNPVIIKEIITFINIDNIYLLSGDKNILVEASSNIYNFKQVEDVKSILLTTKSYINKRINVNCINDTYTTNNNGILNKLMSNELSRYNVNIYIEDNFEYVCDNYSKMLEYISYVNMLLDSNGMLVLIYENNEVYNSKIYNTLEYIFGVKIDDIGTYGDDINVSQDTVNKLYVSDICYDNMFKFMDKFYKFIPKKSLSSIDIDNMMEQLNICGQHVAIETTKVSNMFYNCFNIKNIVSDTCIDLLKKYFDVIESCRFMDSTDNIVKNYCNKHLNKYIKNITYMILSKK